MAWAINESTITCVADGKIYTIQRDHPESKQILRAIRQQLGADQVVALFDKIKAMAAYMGNSVEVMGNTVYCRGEEVHNVVAERILKFMGEGLPHEPLVAFLERLFANPSRRSVEQLYKFLEHKNLPITPDGKFLAYKAIRHDWTDKHSGKFLNTVGAVLSMPRNKVDDNPDSHCSYGFHVGSIEYVESFACGYGSAGGDRIVIVEVDPADVVSVPNDCSCQKVRCCKYKVVAEYTGLLPEGLVRDSSAPYEEPEEYDDDEVECGCGDECECRGDEYERGYRDALAKVQAAAEEALSD